MVPKVRVDTEHPLLPNVRYSTRSPHHDARTYL